MIEYVCEMLKNEGPYKNRTVLLCPTEVIVSFTFFLVVSSTPQEFNICYKNITRAFITMNPRTGLHDYTLF
jgi:hypothetical protein